MDNIELTILMPCLNEAETLRTCIEKASRFLSVHGVSGEILIADNGSTDGSQQIAEECGARLVNIPVRGYGAALIGGCEAANGKYVIMGDADDSYDFSALMPFLERLRQGDALVMGNRFKGGIKKGAMPPLHRYLGNPVLSFIGRLFYPSSIGDFHCGLRGYNTEAMRDLHLNTTGMEYASEMVVKATLHGLAISEVPIILYPDGRSRPPHLRSWRDGWRHLKFLLMYSPNWLFFVPGGVCFILGLAFTLLLLPGPLVIGSVSFDVNTMVYMIVLMLAGYNIMTFGVIEKTYAIQTGFIPIDKHALFYNKINAENGTRAGAVMALLGIVTAIGAVIYWGSTSFGELNTRETLRMTLPSLALIVMGVQTILTSFLIDILRIKHV